MTKHSVTQYSGLNVAQNIFFFFNFGFADGQQSGAVSTNRHKLVSLSKLFWCLRRLCLVPTQLEQLCHNMIQKEKTIKQQLKVDIEVCFCFKNV